MLELSRTQRLVLLSIGLPTTAVLLYVLYRSREKEDEEDLVEMQNVVTSRQTVIEMQIPRQIVGSIIGRQGQRIKEEQTGARMNFKDDGKEEEDEFRTIVIRGTQETAQSAECLIRKFMADMPVVVQDEMYVPGTALGRIIGRNGESVRQMSRSSKTKIYIDRTRAEYRDQPRLVTISGTKEQIVIAKSLIQEKVDEEEQFRAKAAVVAANRESRPKVTEHPPKVQIHEKVENGLGSERGLTTGHDDQSKATTVVWPRNREFVDVYVSAVANPSIFWVHVVCSEALRLDELTEHMTRYYSSGLSKASVLTKLNVGDYVAAPFEQDTSWYRAQVMGFEGSKVDLFYADYGDSGYLEQDLLKPLSAAFLEIPLQAVECRLAGIKSKADEEWSEEAVERFEDLTYCAKWKVVVAKAEAYTDSVPHLTLIDTNSAKDVNINEQIVAEGFAVQCS